MEHKVYVVSVLTVAGGGGNPAPIVLDPTGMTNSKMQDVARDHARESAFVLPASTNSEYDFSSAFGCQSMRWRCMDPRMCDHIIT
jgi:predicted PhzF superfamily epimerase YddE/YHI9